MAAKQGLRLKATKKNSKYVLKYTYSEHISNQGKTHKYSYSKKIYIKKKYAYK